MAIKVGTYIQFPNGDAVQTVFLSGFRSNATAGATGSSEVAVPTGARLLAVRATDAVWLRFGNTGMPVATADANSILFPAGEAVIPVPLLNGVPYTHFSVMRVGDVDVPVQVEQVSVVNG